MRQQRPNPVKRFTSDDEDRAFQGGVYEEIDADTFEHILWSPCVEQIEASSPFRFNSETMYGIIVTDNEGYQERHMVKSSTFWQALMATEIEPRWYERQRPIDWREAGF